jgi:hypothetical protein
MASQLTFVMHVRRCEWCSGGGPLRLVSAPPMGWLRTLNQSTETCPIQEEEKETQSPAGPKVDSAM